MSSIHPLIPAKQHGGGGAAAALREGARRALPDAAALPAHSDIISAESQSAPPPPPAAPPQAPPPREPPLLPPSPLRPATPRDPECECVPQLGSTPIVRKFHSGAGEVWSRGDGARAWGAPPPPGRAYVAPVPRALHFADFIVGRTYTKDVRAVNLGTPELRVSVHVCVLEEGAEGEGEGQGQGAGEGVGVGKGAGTLGAYWVGGGGAARVPGGAYRRLRVTFRPRHPHVLHAHITLRAHVGAPRRVPVSATPRASHLHVSVVEELELDKCGAPLSPRSPPLPSPLAPPLPLVEAWLSFGPMLVGALLRRALRLRSERGDVTYIILAHDEGDYFDVQWVCGTSPSGWVRAGEFALHPRCVRVRAARDGTHGVRDVCDTVPGAAVGSDAVSGAGVCVRDTSPGVGACVRVHVKAELPGAVRAAVRLTARGGATRTLHLHAYALYFHPRHVTIESLEEDFGVLEDSSDAVAFYLLLRATSPGIPQGDLVLVNNSCLWYRWHWVLYTERPDSESGVCEEQSAASSESAAGPGVRGRGTACQRAACPRVQASPPHLVPPPPALPPPPPRRTDVTDLLCPPAGVAPPHSRTRLHLSLPPPAQDPVDIRLILEDIPRISFPRNYVPDIEYSTFEPTDDSGIIGGHVCAVRAAMIRARAVVTSRRALLLPPAISLHHSFRMCAVSGQFRCVFVRSASDDYTSVPPAPAPEPRRAVLLLRRAPCHCEPKPCACEYTLKEAKCNKPQVDHVTVVWSGGQVCAGRVSRRVCPRSPRLAPPRAPRPARACLPAPAPAPCPPTCAPCPPCRLVLPALTPGTPTATTLHLHNDTYEQVECLLDLHWVALGVARCEARAGRYSLAARTDLSPIPPHAPCSRACEAGGRCECRCMLPRSQRLAPGASAKLLVSYTAPPIDGCRLALVWSRRTELARLAPVWHRASLLSARAVAPRLSMRVHAHTGGDVAACGESEAGWRRCVRGSVRAGAALLYTLRVHNHAPTPTTLRVDTATDDDEFMKIILEPNEIDIEGFSKSDLRVSVVGLRACERRVRVRRMRARALAVPLYLIVEADVTGVEVTYEIPMGNGPRADLVIYHRSERPASVLWAPEWTRGLMAPGAVFYRDEQLAISQQYGGTAPPPCLCLLPAPRCSCVQRVRRHTTMQFQHVPIHTEVVRTVSLRVRPHAGRTATWRADVDVLPPPPPLHVRALTKGEWEMPGAWLWVTSREHSDGDVTCIELTLHFRAHCWGVYRDQLAIQVVGVEPLVVRVWGEAVGAPARLLAASPPPRLLAASPPPRLLAASQPPRLLHTDSPPHPPPTHTGDLNNPYLLWITPGEGPRSLRLKNDSPACLQVQMFVMQAYEVEEDGSAPVQRPFRLLYRLEDAPADLQCACPDRPPCLSSVSVWTGDEPVPVRIPLLPPPPSPPPPPRHDVCAHVALGPDVGTQGDTRYKVEPSGGTLPGYGITEFSVIENPDSKSETDTIIFIHLTPEQEHGWWWCRGEAAALCARVPAALRPPRPRLLCAAPNELCLAADAFQLHTNKLNIVLGSVTVRSFGCIVSGCVRASPSPPWRLRAPSHPAQPPAPSLPLLLPAHATLLVQVEACVEAHEVWAAEERRMSRTSLASDTTRDRSTRNSPTPRDRARDKARDKARERRERLRERELARDAVWDTAPDILRDLRDGLLRFYDERDEEILRVPMSLALHFPQLLMSPARLSLPAAAAATAEGYFTISHTYKYPMEVLCTVENDELFSLEPTSMVLAPNETGILYIKFRTEWSASLPVGEPSWTWSLVGESEPDSHTCHCEEEAREVCVCGDETLEPTREESRTELTQTLARHGQLHSCRVTCVCRGAGGVERRAVRYVTAVCSRDRAAAPPPHHNYYTAPPLPTQPTKPPH